MLKDRKLLSRDTITESLIGQIVLFKLSLKVTVQGSTIIFDGDRRPCEVVLQVQGIGNDRIKCGFIAGDKLWGDYYHTSLSEDEINLIFTTFINLSNITGYQILTQRDLPLLIGYKYKSSLLTELIKQGE